jgi:hypothetical protein
VQDGLGRKPTTTPRISSCLAFLELQAIRPTWDEGQPEFTRTRGSGRVFCANEDCQQAIGRDCDQLARYCSEVCRLRAKSKRGYWDHQRQAIIRAQAQRDAARAAATPRNCELCGREFQPLDDCRRAQRFCSKTCRSRYASSWAATWRRNGPGPKPNGKANGHSAPHTAETSGDRMTKADLPSPALVEMCESLKQRTF